jgi:hypothetical protein
MSETGQIFAQAGLASREPTRCPRTLVGHGQKREEQTFLDAGLAATGTWLGARCKGARGFANGQGWLDEGRLVDIWQTSNLGLGVPGNERDYRRTEEQARLGDDLCLLVQCLLVQLCYWGLS